MTWRYIVYVNPRAYDQLPNVESKMKIAHVVNLLNKAFTERRYALMGPGRWGSNDIDLGVRVTYADINNTKLLVEVAFAKEGYTPEVSYGTHFFQDLVEADIVIVPLFPDDPGTILNEAFLLDSHNTLGEIVPEMKDCENVVRVIEIPAVRAGAIFTRLSRSHRSEGDRFLWAPMGERGDSSINGGRKVWIGFSAGYNLPVKFTSETMWEQSETGCNC